MDSITRWGLQAARAVSPATHVGIHGFYGARNVGDDAILDATIQTVRCIGLEPLVVAWSPATVQSDLGVRAISARAGQAPLRIAMHRMRAFVLGGGGLIKDYGSSSASLAHWMRGLRLAARLGIPTMTWSVGVDTLRFADSLQLVRETMDRVDVVTVRDHESSQALRALGVTRDIVVTADPVPAFAIPHRRPAAQNERPHIVLALRHWYVGNSQAEDPKVLDCFLTALASALDRFVTRTGARVTFVPLRAVDGDDDRKMGAAVVARMNTPEVDVVSDASPTMETTIQHLRSADAVVAMRLHGAILASTLGIPTVGVSYAPKVASYMRQIGMEDYCRDLSAVSVGWLVERIEAALTHHADLRRDLLSATDRMAEAYRENGRLLRSLL